MLLHIATSCAESDVNHFVFYRQKRLSMFNDRLDRSRRAVDRVRGFIYECL